ncbi:unnamed protein product [Candidula unifasciata]|uniref:Uncharacterized protein n=1 Tax=Candidula unifasciata TaxID=100452 RepID=A0A8S3YKP1_9EUPU|nr:unnamed protein product [Candidula unifasciata]
MSEQLNGKVAVVTGSSSGLGEAVAVLFASRGAKVTLCGRNEERLRSVLEKVVKASGGHEDRFLTVKGDLNDKNVRKEIVEKTVEKFGRLDILVPNAGVIHPNQSISTATEEIYDDIMDTNLKSVFFLIQEAVPYLEKTKGTIINVSSASTNMAIPSLAVSLLSKVALDHLTKCLAVDLGAKGIRVNSVNPGFFPTRALRNMGDDLEKAVSSVQALEKDKAVLRGRVGTVKDFAEAVLFLASGAAGFINGELLKVDGGRSYGALFTLTDTEK